MGRVRADAGGGQRSRQVLQAEQGGLAGRPLVRLSTPNPRSERIEQATAVAATTLKQIGTALSRVPAGFEVHPRIARQLEAKQAMIDRGEGIDWATGEALAFGSLLLEGTACACPARTASAARSASATRC